MPRRVLPATVAVASLVRCRGESGGGPGSPDAAKRRRPLQRFLDSLPSGAFPVGRLLQPTADCRGEEDRGRGEHQETTRLRVPQSAAEICVGSWSAGLATGVVLDLCLRRVLTQKPPPGPRAVVAEIPDSEEVEVSPKRGRTDEVPKIRPGQRKLMLGHRPISLTYSHAFWRVCGFIVAIVFGVATHRRWTLVCGRLRQCLTRSGRTGAGGTRKAPVGGVPVLPGAKGKGPPPPGKGGPPAPAKGAPPKAGGKGKAPPPKAKAKALSPRILAGDQAEDAEGSCVTPFGRKIHWVQPSYQEPAGDSIFGKLGSSGPSFDPKLLTAIFTPEAPERRRSWSAQKDVGKCILDTQRAQGAAIMVNRLKMTTVELCRCVNTLDFDDVRLRVDDIEMVSMAMPTPEESAKLLNCGTEVSQLRDIEQKLIPLCALNVASLRVMKFGLLHASLHADIIGRCGVIRTAAEEAQRSTQFMEFLRLSLQVGNFINHGEAEMKKGMVRSFALESLQMLSSCKAGPVSALHFVCLTLRSEDPGFLQSLKDSLSHSREASREKTVALEGDVANFSKEVQFLRQRFERLGPEDELKGKMKRLLATVEEEEKELKELIRKSLASVSDAQAYFNVSVKEGAKPPTSDQFFGCITTTLENFQTAWREVERNGRRWERKLEGVGGEMAERLARPGLSKASKAKTVPLDTGSDASNVDSGAELTKAALAEADGLDGFTPSHARKSCPAALERVPGLRQPKGKRSLKTGATKLGQATRRMTPYLPKVSPRLTPRIELPARSKVCEFHAIHEQDSNSDTNGKVSKLKMPRSTTAFPDLCEFQREPTEQAERTWDFAISGTSAYSMSLRRRQKQFQKQLSPQQQQQQQQAQEQYLRQKTC